MVDARLPDRWLTDVRMLGLSDHAWRIFTSMLMWSAAQQSDGEVPRAAHRLLHPSAVGREQVQELLDAGLVEKTENGLQIVDWAETQSTAAQIKGLRDRKRQNAADLRDRERAKREQARALPAAGATPTGAAWPD